MILLGAAGHWPASVTALDCYREIDPYYWTVDIPSMIHIASPTDAVRVRTFIRNYIWRQAPWPTRLPDEVRATEPCVALVLERSRLESLPGYPRLLANLASVAVRRFRRSDERLVDSLQARLRGHIHEAAVASPPEKCAAGVPHEENVQMAVLVVIDPGAAGAPLVGDSAHPRLCSHVHEMTLACIVEEMVLADRGDDCRTDLPREVGRAQRRPEARGVPPAAHARPGNEKHRGR